MAGTIVLIIFGPKRDAVTGEWRQLHEEELNDLYCSPNIVRVIKSRRMRRDGHVAHIGERRGVYRVLAGKSGRKSPLGRPRHRWEDNIKMDLQEAGLGRMDWIEKNELGGACSAYGGEESCIQGFGGEF